MARNDTTKLEITPREAGSSRATRRLRRAGAVPGVLYGGGADPLAFQVQERALRHALQAHGAVVELSLDGSSTPAVLKDAQRHPVRGETLHVDFLRVRLDQAIQSVVPLHLVGAEDAPGAKEGGVLEHVTREINVEALPNDLPEAIDLDVSGMQVNDTLTIASVTPERSVTILDDPETVVATLTPPRLQTELDELEEGIETETERVGEGQRSAADADAGDVPADAADAESE